jgi:predicted secreted protein
VKLRERGGLAPVGHNRVMRLRLLPAVAILVLLAGGLTGCSATRRVGVETGDVTVQKGETLAVELGGVNASIGDSWYLVSSGDRAVLGEPERKYDSDCPKDAAGCGGTLSYEFKAVGVGQTELVFRYCYRSGLDKCDPGPGRGPATPRTIRVTVTK